MLPIALQLGRILQQRFQRVSKRSNALETQHRRAALHGVGAAEDRVDSLVVGDNYLGRSR